MRLAFAGLALASVALSFGAPAPAAAFDFFGLWASEDAPPTISKQSIPYLVTFKITGDASLQEALRAASTLYSLRTSAPPDGDSLARRAARDFAPLVDALWAKGYFNAKISIAIDGTALASSGESAAFARAAEAYRDRALAPITIEVETGPLFKLSAFQVLHPDGRTPISPAELPPRVVGLARGDPAGAEAVRVAQTRIIDYFRAQSRPLAKIVATRPVVDHASLTMDVTIIVDRGPVAGIGEIAIKTPPAIPERVVRSFIYLEPGYFYSPETLERTKTSVRSIPAVGSARFVEGEKLDAAGHLPLELDVGDRPEHAIGVSAKYSTIDGPVGQAYWEHRNLLGGAEYLRLQADLLYAPASLGSIASVGALGNSNIGGRLAAHFVKPALGGSRNDLLIDAVAERAGSSFGHFVGYTVDDVDVSVAVRHRFSQELSAQAGVEARKGLATDALGTVNYTLVGLPASLSYDSTDDKLDPTRGERALIKFEPYPRFLGSTLNLVTWRATASAYHAFDEASRFVLAGRLDIGGESGAATGAIPADMRYYAGGGGSVRGYGYYSLGPLGPGGAVIGGRSVVDGSLEMRMRMTDTIGFVPFIDLGQAYAATTPSFSGSLRAAAGLGLRYYTSFGPLRLDVAAPLNPRPGDPRAAVYISIGQAF